jgi:hypothetical protein
VLVDLDDDGFVGLTAVLSYLNQSGPAQEVFRRRVSVEMRSPRCGRNDEVFRDDFNAEGIGDVVMTPMPVGHPTVASGY